MLFRPTRLLVLAVLIAASSVTAQIGGPPPPDPRAVLQQAKEASGGKAWDALRSQHSAVTMQAAGLTGTAQRWSETGTGRSRLEYSIGPLKGATGFDGKMAWTQDEGGVSRVETESTARELAVNAAFRDRLAFWYPDRGAALVSYKERANADGADFDVIRITPDGGRPFELWINIETKLIERLVEREAKAVRTEIYMDLRDQQGVKIPYRVRASREDPRQDEVFMVDTMQFNQPLTGIVFAQPPPPKPDFTFPAGGADVRLPIAIDGGQIVVRVRIDGKGPFRMLLDSGSSNMLVPDLARTLKLGPDAGKNVAAGGLGAVRAGRLDVGGVVIANPAFVLVDPKTLLRRADGIDDVVGVIGFEVFKRMPISVDFARAQLVLHDPARFKSAGKGAAVPLVFHGMTPRVTGRLDGIGGVFDIGTGAHEILTLATVFVTAHDLVRLYGAKQSVLAGSGPDGTVRGLLARAGEFELGGIVLAKPVVILGTVAASGESGTDAAGSIGSGMLRMFRPTFDYAHGVVYLAPAVVMADSAYFDRAGLKLERVPAGFVVVDVVAGGPAEAAGVKIDDVVTAINGRAAATTTLAAARTAQRAKTGSKLRLQIGPAGERTLILRDLI